MRAASRWLGSILLCLLPVLTLAEVAVPALQRRVTDLTQTLTAAQQQSLEARLQGLEQRSGAQVAILLVPTTLPEDTFSYGMRVVENWKLGQKGKDNGVLILLAKNDRKSQILVGYGLEGDLPDARARRIVDEIGRPWFRSGDFAGGLNAMLSAIAVAIEGRVMEASQAQAQPPAAAQRDHRRAPVDPRQQKALLLVIGLFALGQLLRFAAGPMIAAGVSGAVAVPGIALLVGSLATGLIWGAGLFFLILVFRFTWLLLFLQASGGGYGGGYSRGGGGGFSGGGGGFGGGGSSGSW